MLQTPSAGLTFGTMSTIDRDTAILSPIPFSSIWMLGSPSAAVEDIEE